MKISPIYEEILFNKVKMGLTQTSFGSFHVIKDMNRAIYKLGLKINIHNHWGITFTNEFNNKLQPRNNIWVLSSTIHRTATGKIISPPQGNSLQFVIVTSSEGVYVSKVYREPIAMPGMMGS